MTDKKATKRRKFAHEILGLIGISGGIALVIFLILSNVTMTIAEVYCFENDIPMTEFDWMEVDRWIFGCGAVISLGCFSVLFLSMLGERLAYIRTLTDGINALRLEQSREALPLEGKNELTELAGAINYLSATQRQLREKEQSLAREREQFIRTLSHDIRTPLTSVLAYAEYLSDTPDLSREEQQAHLQTIRKKAEQIRDLTGLLLDGSKRNAEYFGDVHLLMEQLAAEFAEELEDRFRVSVELTGCHSLGGSFDVGELRRIFDNLSSNVQKYADPAFPVQLQIHGSSGALQIRQSNSICADPSEKDSSKLGIHSIRRIAQNYGGTVQVEQDGKDFAITLRLSDF